MSARRPVGDCRVAPVEASQPVSKATRNRMHFVGGRPRDFSDDF